MAQPDTPRVGFQRYDDGEAWEYNTDFELLDDVVPTGLADSGTFTLTGGNTPAASVTQADVTTTQTVGFRVVVGVDSDPAFNADYGFSYTFDAEWDDSDGAWDIPIEVTWTTDPGGGNDVTASYRIYTE